MAIHIQKFLQVTYIIINLYIQKLSSFRPVPGYVPVYSKSSKLLLLELCSKEHSRRSWMLRRNYVNYNESVDLVELEGYLLVGVLMSRRILPNRNFHEKSIWWPFKLDCKDLYLVCFLKFNKERNSRNCNFSQVWLVFIQNMQFGSGKKNLRCWLWSILD